MFFNSKPPPAFPRPRSTNASTQLGNSPAEKASNPPPPASLLKLATPSHWLTVRRGRESLPFALRIRPHPHRQITQLEKMICHAFFQLIRRRKVKTVRPLRLQRRDRLRSLHQFQAKIRQIEFQKTLFQPQCRRPIIRSSTPPAVVSRRRYHVGRRNNVLLSRRLAPARSALEPPVEPPGQLRQSSKPASAIPCIEGLHRLDSLTLGWPFLDCLGQIARSSRQKSSSAFFPPKWCLINIPAPPICQARPILNSL